MEGDNEKTKISYLHHWLNGDGISKIKGWKNSKILLSQEDYDALESKTGKYSLDKIESNFTLCEQVLNKSHLVEEWDFTRSKEDTGTETYGVPTRQGNNEIFPRHD